MHENLFERNRATDAFDFYQHSWNRDLAPAFRELYNFTASAYSDNAPYKEAIGPLLAKPLVHGGGGGEVQRGDASKPAGEWSQMSWSISIVKAVELMLETGNTYDRVILLRPDVVLLYPLDLSKLPFGKGVIDPFAMPPRRHAITAPPRPPRRPSPRAPMPTPRRSAFRRVTGMAEETSTSSSTSPWPRRC